MMELLTFERDLEKSVNVIRSFGCFDELTCGLFSDFAAGAVAFDVELEPEPELELKVEVLMLDESRIQSVLINKLTSKTNDWKFQFDSTVAVLVALCLLV